MSYHSSRPLVVVIALVVCDSRMFNISLSERFLRLELAIVRARHGVSFVVATHDAVAAAYPAVMAAAHAEYPGRQVVWSDAPVWDSATNMHLASCPVAGGWPAHDYVQFGYDTALGRKLYSEGLFADSLRTLTELELDVVAARYRNYVTYAPNASNALDTAETAHDTMPQHETTTMPPQAETTTVPQAETTMPQAETITAETTTQDNAAAQPVAQREAAQPEVTQAATTPQAAATTQAEVAEPPRRSYASVAQVQGDSEQGDRKKDYYMAAFYVLTKATTSRTPSAEDVIEIVPAVYKLDKHEAGLVSEIVRHSATTNKFFELALVADASLILGARQKLTKVRLYYGTSAFGAARRRLADMTADEVLAVAGELWEGTTSEERAVFEAERNRLHRVEVAKRAPHRGRRGGVNHRR